MERPYNRSRPQGNAFHGCAVYGGAYAQVGLYRHRQGIANLPDSKTEAKALHLPLPALVVLAGIPRISEYCFPAKERLYCERQGYMAAAAQYCTAYRLAYSRFASCLRKLCRLFRQESARHRGYPWHTQAATTARYAHLADNPVALAAAETAGAAA